MRGAHRAPTDPCKATTRKGEPCRFAARRDSGLCVNHDPAYARQQQENRARGVEAAAEQRQQAVLSFEEVDLSNRVSVQAVADAVLRLVLSGAISEKRAAQAIRLLSLSVRNFGPAGRMWVDNSTRFYDEREAAFRQFRTFFRQYACDERQQFEREKKQRVRAVDRWVAQSGIPRHDPLSPELRPEPSSTDRPPR